MIRELSSNNIQSDDLARFTNVSEMILEKKAPLKERYVRYNQGKFMNKILPRAIMNRSRLLNRYRREKTVRPSFTDKTLKDERITLLENNKVVSDESELVEIFSKYFGNILQNLGIDGVTNTSSDNDAVII